MKNHITSSLKNFDEENIRNEQIMWETLKYETRKFSKNFSKQISLESNKERQAFEKRVKDFEHDIQNLDDIHEYLTCKNKLDTIYDDIVNGIKVRSHCDWFESGEKSSNVFFFNLEKHRATKSHTRSIPYDEIKINKFSKINDSLYKFYQTLFFPK